MSTPQELLHARRKLCHSLAEALDPGHEPYDIDEARETLEIHLPHSYIESQAEWDSLKESWEKEPAPLKPSKFAQLREVLHAEGLSINCTFEAALTKLRERDALAAEVARLLERIEVLEAPEKERLAKLNTKRDGLMLRRVGILRDAEYSHSCTDEQLRDMSNREWEACMLRLRLKTDRELATKCGGTER